jgi:hypothetical protein
MDSISHTSLETERYPCQEMMCIQGGLHFQLGPGFKPKNPFFRFIFIFYFVMGITVLPEYAEVAVELPEKTRPEVPSVFETPIGHFFRNCRSKIYGHVIIDEARAPAQVRLNLAVRILLTNEQRPAEHKQD